MWENGVFRTCHVCGKRFYCIDGDYVCSGTCDEIEERQEAEEYHERTET